MNKFLVSLALVSSLSISSLIATESSTLNKTDSELLFGTTQNVNVAVLSENEMKETKGEFWGAVSAIIAGADLIYNIGEDNNWW
ncbi:hypothetical protein LS74_002785 [Helicobacter magdeburgensis]|uniref:Bacteriocin n=1 Tax=Helicobacter magdeburgensis TaxID=471858 RepID=A0A4U8T145_9HELI|nr:hypothetical protein [Helicobacter magdeburgensis]TLD93085.1 hypothetical protein LS74_002785 [Helicobacter magdeburgensis]